MTDQKTEQEKASAELWRYDLVTNYRCGSSIEEMERSDDGEWVRFDDVEQAVNSHDALVAALREVLHHGDDEYGFMVNVRSALKKAEAR